MREYRWILRNTRFPIGLIDKFMAYPPVDGTMIGCIGRRERGWSASYRGKRLCLVPFATKEQAYQAVDAAHESFVRLRAFSRKSAEERRAEIEQMVASAETPLVGGGA